MHFYFCWFGVFCLLSFCFVFGVFLGWGVVFGLAWFGFFCFLSVCVCVLSFFFTCENGIVFSHVQLEPYVNYEERQYIEGATGK